MSFLFSYRKGWLLYTPIFIISFLGLYKMLKAKSKWTLPIVISLGITIYIFFHLGGVGGTEVVLA